MPVAVTQLAELPMTATDLLRKKPGDVAVSGLTCSGKTGIAPVLHFCLFTGRALLARQKPCLQHGRLRKFPHRWRCCYQRALQRLRCHGRLRRQAWWEWCTRLCDSQARSCHRLWLGVVYQLVAFASFLPSGPTAVSLWQTVQFLTEPGYTDLL